MTPSGHHTNKDTGVPNDNPLSTFMSNATQRGCSAKFPCRGLLGKSNNKASSTYIFL